MANTALPEIGSSLPDVSAMTKVLDTDIVLDKKVGAVMNWTEMMKFELDTPFRYTGENLMVVVQVENETPQRVYFCVNNAYADLSLQGTGHTSDMASFSCSNSGLPTTGIYYAEPVETAVPEITLVTAREPGQKLALSLTSRDGVRIDWGGSVKEYPYGGTLTLNHDLAGDVIKIYTLSEDDHVQSFLCNSYDLLSVTLEAPVLKSLQLRDNRLESIDLEGAPLVEVLVLSVPSDALGYIDCTRNQLEAVSLSRHPNLYQLMLDFNKLTSVNLASNKNLWGVSLRANSLEAEAIGRICSQLPDVNDLAIIPDYESWMKIIFLSGNPGVATADVDEAVGKGWAVVMNENIPVDRILQISVVDSDETPCRVQGLCSSSMARMSALRPSSPLPVCTSTIRFRSSPECLMKCVSRKKASFPELSVSARSLMVILL